MTDPKPHLAPLMHAAERAADIPLVGRLAEAGAVTAAGTALGLSLGEWSHVVSIIASVVGVLAGLFAAAYHFLGVVNRLRSRRDRK